MDKIEEIIIGTNNQGKYKEIYDLIPDKIKKYSPKKLDILSPEETGKSFKENSFIKASYFSKQATKFVYQMIPVQKQIYWKVNLEFILQGGEA